MNENKIPSKLGAIVQGKCPRCRTGKMFEASTFNLRKFAKMHKSCPHCEQDLQIEPGFYYGAAYISYALNVAVILVCIFVYFVYLDHYSEWWLIATVSTLVILLLPVNYRLSRTLMIHFFSPVKFEAHTAR